MVLSISPTPVLKLYLHKIFLPNSKIRSTLHKHLLHKLYLRIKAASPPGKPNQAGILQQKAISPDLERLMAKRINAKTTEIEASHVVMVSHAKEVVAIIEQAANSAK